MSWKKPACGTEIFNLYFSFRSTASETKIGTVAPEFGEQKHIRIPELHPEWDKPQQDCQDREDSNDENKITQSAPIAGAALNPIDLQLLEQRQCKITSTVPTPESNDTQLTQTTLDQILTSSAPQTQPTEPTVKELSYKLDKVLNLLTENTSRVTSKTEKNCPKDKDSVGDTPGSSAANISDFLEQNKDIELVGESEHKILRCKICFVYLNSKTALQRASHLPSSGCIATGLPISQESYQNCVLGHNNVWYRFKKRMLDHFSCNKSKTHMDALAWWHFTKAVRQRKTQVVENQIRTALGVVKTKSAAQSYETRIAELQMSGAIMHVAINLFT